MINNLPVLAPSNKQEYLDWHKYFERVYNHPVDCNVDLNEFTFFYNDSPIGIPRMYNYFPQENQAWTSPVPYFPEHYIRSIGFFVKRKNSKIKKGKIEVIRTSFSNDDAMTGVGRIARKFPLFSSIGESKLVWFFIVKGSGVFIDTMNRRILKMKDRDEWPVQKWKGEGENDIINLIDQQNVDTVIFTNSLCKGAYPPWSFVQFFTHERPEMFIKLERPDDTSCPNELEYFTGWKGIMATMPDRTNCRYLNSGKCPYETRTKHVNYANLKRIIYILLMVLLSIVRVCTRIS